MPDTTAASDEIVVRTDAGLIHATVTELTECERPPDGARLGGTAEIDTPAVHYVDYNHNDSPDPDLESQ